MHDTAALIGGPFGSRRSGPQQDQEFDRDERDEIGIDLVELQAMLYRQRFWIAGCVLIALIVGIVLTMIATPVYRSTATVEIEEDTSIVAKGQEALQPTITGQNIQRRLQVQADILKSRNVALRVATQLRLGNDEAFAKAFKIPSGLSEAQRTEFVIAALQAHLKIHVPFGSQILLIHFESSDPVLNARVANAYANNLIAGNLERRFEASSYAREFLSKEIQQAKERLEASERAALEYAKSAQLVAAQRVPPSGASKTGDAAPAAPSSLSAANLFQMNSDLATARTARILAEERWRAASMTPLMSLPEVVENPAIQQLQSERARLESTLSRLRDTYGEEYPEVARALAGIAGLDAQIQRIAGQIKGSIRERFDSAVRQEAAMAGRISGLKAATLEEQDKRVRLDILNREVATNLALYDALLQRFHEVSTAASVANNNINVLDQAIPNRVPVAPRPLLNIMIALVAGLAIGAVAAFVRERLDDTIRVPEDVYDRLQVPLLGTTPVVSKWQVESELSHGRSSLSEAYHSIRSSVAFALKAEPPNSLLVTSSRAAEGKSTSALAIATDFARIGQKVLLVDADIRVPSLHSALRVDNGRGLVHVLSNHAEIKDVVHHLDGLDFISSGPTPVNPTEILASHRIEAFLRKAYESYEFVLIDGPPVMGLADSPQIARVVDATVLIVESNRAHRVQVKTALRRLRDANANILGIVLSKFSAKSSGYGDDYGYYYYYGTAKES